MVVVVLVVLLESGSLLESLVAVVVVGFGGTVGDSGSPLQPCSTVQTEGM